MTVAVDHKALLGSGGSGPGRNTTGGVPKVDPTLPQLFGRYLLVQRLSRGGMGEIFLAKHGLSGFEKLCVIKKVLPNLAEDEQFISRFVDEAQVAIKLQHVNVAQVFEVGRVGDEYFLSIEYVDGRDLRRTLQVMGRQKRRFPPELALFIAREMANGLAYAHRRTSQDGSSLNLVHCDISPPNVLVSFEGETKIIDFGIAKSALRATATDPKMGFGKFGYMAPEQLIRGGMVDHRTDIYAAGVVLFELLTGHRLYELGQDGAPDYRALARAVSRGEHDLPSDIDPMLGPYDELVARALRPAPADRFQTAAEFRDAIQTSLVAVSPTMSSDQLGSYLREVFADEMNAHQEMFARVSQMHLDDFREQLTTQSVETVSFALANMPLTAPPELATGKATPIPAKNLRPEQQSTAVAGMMLTGTGPTGTAELSESDLVAGDATTSSPRRRAWGVLAAIGVAALAVVVIVVVAAGGSSRPRAAAARAGVVDAGPRAAPSDARQAVITPLDVPADAAVAVTAPVDAAPAPVRTHPTVVRKDHPETAHPHPPDKPHDPPPAGVDADAVLAKFKAVSREYKDFKQAFGARLDAEWTDLATTAQYAKGSPDKLQQLDRALDHFRSLMRAQK